MSEYEPKVVKVPNFLQIHPQIMERYEREQEELDRLLTPEAKARLDEAEAEMNRRLFGC